MEVSPGVAGRPFQLGKRLLFHGDDGHVVTEAARTLERKEGKPAVAGNQTNTGHLKSKNVRYLARMLHVGQTAWRRVAARCPRPDKRSLSLGQEREMFRRIACGILLSASVALSGLCGEISPRRRGPTPVAITAHVHRHRESRGWLDARVYHSSWGANCRDADGRRPGRQQKRRGLKASARSTRRWTFCTAVFDKPGGPPGLRVQSERLNDRRILRPRLR